MCGGGGRGGECVCEGGGHVRRDLKRCVWGDNLAKYCQPRRLEEEEEETGDVFLLCVCVRVSVICGGAHPGRE